MSGQKTDPFDRTVIIPGVPELPAEPAAALPVAQPASTAATSKPVSKPRKSGVAIALWAAALVLLTGGMTWWFLGPEASAPKTVMAAGEPVPPALKGYLDAADHGDAKAMRMLGASYTYGLGVRPDKAEGAAWYRKAADAGDKMAAQELAAVGGR